MGHERQVARFMREFEVIGGGGANEPQACPTVVEQHVDGFIGQPRGDSGARLGPRGQVGLMGIAAGVLRVVEQHDTMPQLLARRVPPAAGR